MCVCWTTPQFKTCGHTNRGKLHIVGAGLQKWPTCQLKIRYDTCNVLCTASHQARDYLAGWLMGFWRQHSILLMSWRAACRAKLKTSWNNKRKIIKIIFLGLVVKGSRTSCEHNIHQRSNISILLFFLAYLTNAAVLVSTIWLFGC